MTFYDPKVRLRLKEIGDMQHVGRHWAKSPMAKNRYCKEIAETTWQWKFQKFLLENLLMTVVRCNRTSDVIAAKREQETEWME